MSTMCLYRHFPAIIVYSTNLYALSLLYIYSFKYKTITVT